MSEVEDLSDLISAIYDASLDASLWRPALEKTATFIETATASLVSSDSQRPAIDFASSWGDDPAYTAVFLERYMHFQPPEFRRPRADDRRGLRVLRLHEPRRVSRD